MSEPTTEAGKRLAQSAWALGPGEPFFFDSIAAIEAEARAAEEARWRRLPGAYRREEGTTEVVVDVPESLSWLQDEFPDELAAYRAAVLRELREEVEGMRHDMAPHWKGWDEGLDAVLAAIDRRLEP